MMFPESAQTLQKGSDIEVSKGGSKTKESFLDKGWSALVVLDREYSP